MRNNKGETLIETIISIAIFSLLMAMVTTIFSQANNIEASNFESRNKMNEKLLLINEATPEDASSKGLSVSNGTTVVHCQINSRNNGTNQTKNFKVYEIRTSDDVFVKIVHEKPRKNGGNGNNGNGNG